ncbi:MAG: hypothetical protein ACTSPA_14820 [Promethearchaeota archaeon]
MIIKRNKIWIKYADLLDTKVNKIIVDNPGKYMKLQIELNQDTWDEIKDIPEDEIEKLTLLEYFKGYTFKMKGYTFKMVRIAEDIKINNDENLKGEYLEVSILKISK